MKITKFLGAVLSTLLLGTSIGAPVVLEDELVPYAFRTNVWSGSGSGEGGKWTSSQLENVFEIPLNINNTKLTITPGGITYNGAAGNINLFSEGLLMGVKEFYPYGGGVESYQFPSNGVAGKRTLATTDMIPDLSQYVTTTQVSNIVDSIINYMVDVGGITRNGTNYVLVIQPQNNEETSYDGYIPTGDPLYYSVTKDGTYIERQISGPPYSWFKTNTDSSASFSDSGTFKFSFDGSGNIIVTVDSNIASIYDGTPPYNVGDVVATINQETMAPTWVNGYFRWLENLSPGN